MIRAFGVLLFSLFLFGSLSAYRKEENRGLSEYRGLYRLILHLSSAISELPLPLCEIYATFEDDALLAAGFLPILQKEGLAAALSRDCVRIEHEKLAPFRDYAKGLGTRLYTEEQRAARQLAAEAERTLAAWEAALPQSQKITRTLSLTGGALVLLLLL